MRLPIILALAVPVLAGTGTTDAYYLTRALTNDVNNSQTQVVVVQGTSTINSFVNPTRPTNRWEYAIAISGDVRTIGTHFLLGYPSWADPTGGLYSLSGAWMGVAYTVPTYIPTGGSAPVLMADTWDSTTDGRHNYLVSYSQGDVVQTDRDFTNPVILFHLPGGGYSGITYDRQNGTLWLSGYSNTLVKNFDMQGHELSSFSTGHGQNTALAYESATNTLWLANLVSLDTSVTRNSLEQWTKTGQLLQTVPNMPVILGGEMADSDHTSPVIGGMPTAGCTLWPPNKKMLQVAHVTALDFFPGMFPNGLNVTAVSNEPMNSNAPDVLITADGSGGFSVSLRADRLGTGSGRVYTITATASDVAGNSSVITSACTVPHDQGN